MTQIPTATQIYADFKIEYLKQLCNFNIIKKICENLRYKVSALSAC